MPKDRRQENKNLPERWVRKHGAIYYFVPKDEVSKWGKQWYRLGKTEGEALTEFKRKSAEIAETAEIAILDIHEKAHGCGVRQTPSIYFLFRGNTIVYVGKALNPFSRMLGHADKEFDWVYFLPTPPELLHVYEIAYISKYTPEYNIRHAGSGTEKLYFGESIRRGER